MNRYIRQFEGQDVEILYNVEDQKTLFRLEDVARAAGFNSVRALRYHTKTKVREVKIKDSLYLKARALTKIAKSATKTPGMARFAKWATGLAGKINIREIKGKPIQSVIPSPKPVLPYEPFGYILDVPASHVDVPQFKATNAIPQPILYTLTNAATNLGMTVKELSDWMVDEGYASRYDSTNAIYFSDWFKDQKYGTYPTVTDSKGTRTIRSPKLTEAGFEYVKSRLESERESKVLSFAKKESYQTEQMELDVNQLIIDTFVEEEHGTYHNLLGTTPLYKMGQAVLIRKVKRIIAEVKLKEK